MCLGLQCYWRHLPTPPPPGRFWSTTEREEAGPKPSVLMGSWVAVGGWALSGAQCPPSPLSKSGLSLTLSLRARYGWWGSGAQCPPSPLGSKKVKTLLPCLPSGVPVLPAWDVWRTEDVAGEMQEFKVPAWPYGLLIAFGSPHWSFLHGLLTQAGWAH